MPGKILIYGATGGIGEATARALRAKGYALHLTAREPTRLAALAGELDVGFTAADIEEPGAFARVAGEAGPALAGLVYAVGTIDLKPFARASEADFQRAFRINAQGAALAVQAALPALKAAADTAGIVLFSSIAARQGFAAHAAIAMAKGAVEGLTLSLAAELAPKIRVNAIAPSLTRTPLAAALTGNAAMAAGIAALHPIPRLGEPADMAALAAFLVSDEAGWITGQVFGVDGGRSSLRVKG
jgi:NAD(P)-dependent dehydrogenase (short-subunit alcohol dehydrogenase family)